MTDQQALEKRVMEGDVDAFVPLADSLMDQDHPDGEELGKLAIEVVTSESWANVIVAMASFQELLTRGKTCST